MSRKQSNDRLESSIKYVDALSYIYSKLNVIRVDFGYKSEYSAKMTLKQVNEDITRMLNNRRSKPSIFEHNVGYIIKKEFTEDKHIHIHTLFFFDGQKIQKDSFKAEQIGAYWQEIITEEKGSFHNCHRNTYEQNGIGMLNYADHKKRQILNERVISYLCKDEQDIASVKENIKDRAFLRGTLPKTDKKEGRPRKKSNN